jgi:S-adenosylmethionine:tRNA ribosyltransferase-isomerase
MYSLSEDRIAKYPLPERDQSKLLIYKNGKITESCFRNIAGHIPSQSRLYMNNTKVIHARLKFVKPAGAAIEVFCLSPHDPSDYQLSFSQTGSCTWVCMIGNRKKWKNGLLRLEFERNGHRYTFTAEKNGSCGEYFLIRFQWNGDHSFGEVLDALGIIPLPPYLNRNSEPLDKDRYQTIYSHTKGSVAAPTAGLHFTGHVLAELKKKQVYPKYITLHVGAGTFQPVKSENALDHAMHSEVFSVSVEVLESLICPGGPIVATGTTTLRTLESLYWLGVKSICTQKLCHDLEQWEYKRLPKQYSAGEALRKLIDLLKQEKLSHLEGITSLMIVPGYEFNIVDILITNYHQPGSTLLLLVGAFIGEGWKQVYDHALEHNYRFLSYGDSSILWRK